MELGPSGMKVWVILPGKPTGSTEVIVKDEGNLEGTVQEGNNEYQPLTVLRPTIASGDVVFFPVNLSL